MIAKKPTELELKPPSAELELKPPSAAVDHHAHNDNIMRNTCDRCGAGPDVITIMSHFNTDILCMPCNERESAHPDYRKAVEADDAEVLKGNVNYQGIGKPRDL